MSFAEVEFAGKKRKTRREIFLGEMDAVIPWSRLVGRIAPHYPKGERGRPPIGLERMLRIYFLQQWYGLADEHLEETIYDSQAMRAPSSTKNKKKERDPEMHQTKKGNQWHFGMKAHIGGDTSSGLVHSVESTAANEADINQAHTLLHGEEKHAFGDAGYTGVEKRTEITKKAPKAKWYVAAKPGAVKRLPEGPLKEAVKAYEKAKAQVRAMVEHPFHIIKNLFHHRKVRYRGIAKNAAQLETLFALANLVIAKRFLLPPSRSQAC